MNTGELIERVRLEIHNDLTDSQIVGRFNELSKRLFRKFVLPETIYGFYTTEIPYYALPEDCPEDRVRCVVINGIEYLKVSPEVQNPPSYFCTAFEGAVFICPAPAPNSEGFIYYRSKPITLSASELSKTPNFPEDYHEMYVYDAASWIAGIQRDTDMKNNFQAEFDSIFKDAERDLKKMGMRRAKETIRW
ncbi:phage adaptor protein [Paenibacillus sp. CAU 1782]